MMSRKLTTEDVLQLLEETDTETDDSFENDPDYVPSDDNLSTCESQNGESGNVEDEAPKGDVNNNGTADRPPQESGLPDTTDGFRVVAEFVIQHDELNSSNDVPSVVDLGQVPDNLAEIDVAEVVQLIEGQDAGGYCLHIYLCIFSLIQKHMLLNYFCLITW